MAVMTGTIPVKSIRKENYGARSIIELSMYDPETMVKEEDWEAYNDEGKVKIEPLKKVSKVKPAKVSGDK